MTRSLARLIVILVSIATLNGCAKQEKNPDESAGGSRTQTALAPSVGAPPTEDECWEFAVAFEEAAYEQNATTLSRLIDWEAIAEEASEGIDAPAAFKRDFMQGFISASQEGQSGLITTLLDTTSQGGTLTPLTVIGGKAKQGVRFRILHADGSLNYFDFYLARREGGAIKAVDIFLYAVGESISQTVRQIYLSAAADAQRSLLQRLTGKEQAIMTHLPTLIQMNDDLRNGRPQAVLSAYHSLPDELKRERLFLVPRYSAASEIDDAEYAAALADFRRYYPDDPSADLLLIDAHFLQGEFDDSLAAIDRLEESIGLDPYLNVLRANIHLELDHHETARSLIQEALELEPYLIDAYWSLIALSIEERDFDETARLLDLVAEQFEIEFFNLAEIPEYADFVASPQYEKWLERHSQSQSSDDPSPLETESLDEVETIDS